MSATVMSPACAPTVTLSPGRPAWSAFSIRFEIAWSSAPRVAGGRGVPVRVGAQLDREPIGEWGVAFDRVARRASEVDRLVADAEVALLETRQVEQVAHQPLEALALERDHRGALVDADRAVAQRLRVAADRGQRRLQLVADGEQERALALAGRLKLRLHVVEGLRQIGDLFRPGDGDRLRRPPRSERAGGARDAHDGGADALGERERDARGEGRADECGEQEAVEIWRPVGGSKPRGTVERERVGRRCERVDRVEDVLAGNRPLALAAMARGERGERRGRQRPAQRGEARDDRVQSRVSRGEARPSQEARPVGIDAGREQLSLVPEVRDARLHHGMAGEHAGDQQARRDRHDDGCRGRDEEAATQRGQRPAHVRLTVRLPCSRRRGRSG